MTSKKSILTARRFVALIVVAIVVSIAIPLLIGGKQSLQQIRSLPAETYLALFAVMAVSWVARSLKLHLLMLRLGADVMFLRTFAMSMAIDFAFITTPGGVGGYAANIYLARRVGLSTSAATTVTAIDQLLDLAFFALAMPLAALSLLLMHTSEALALFAFGFSVSMVALSAIGAVMHRRLLRWVCGDNVFVRRWPSLKRRQCQLQEFIEHAKGDARLLASGSPIVTALLLGCTALQWLARYGVLWLALALLGTVVPFALTLMSQSVVLHAAMWTGVPSGGGGAELGLSAALVTMVPTATIATALILWRLTTFHLCLVSGLLAIAWLARNGDIQGDAARTVIGEAENSGT